MRRDRPSTAAPPAVVFLRPAVLRGPCGPEPERPPTSFSASATPRFASNCYHDSAPVPARKVSRPGHRLLQSCQRRRSPLRGHAKTLRPPSKHGRTRRNHIRTKPDETTASARSQTRTTTAQRHSPQREKWPTKQKLR